MRFTSRFSLKPVMMRCCTSLMLTAFCTLGAASPSAAGDWSVFAGLGGGDCRSLTADFSLRHTLDPLHENSVLELRPLLEASGTVCEEVRRAYMGRRGGGRSDRGVQTGRSVASLSFRQFRNLSAFGRQNGDAQAWRAFSVPLQGKRGNKIRRGTPALHPGGCRALFQRRHIYFQFRIRYVRPFLRLSVLRLPAKPMEENPARTPAARALP